MKTIRHTLTIPTSDITVKLGIGNGQPGSFIWSSGIKPETMPSSDSTEWTTVIKGEKNKNCVLKTNMENKNPDTNWTELEIFIDSNKVESEELSYEASENEFVRVILKIKFS